MMTEQARHYVGTTPAAWHNMNFIKSTKGKIVIIASAVVVAAAIAVFIFTNGWKENKEGLRYLKFGKALTGFNTIDGTDYIFTDKGILYMGWFEYQGNEYFQDENGLYEGDKLVGKDDYHFDDDGKFFWGVYTNAEGKLCLRTEKGFQPVGPYFFNGKYYYVNEDGTLLLGWASNDTTGPYYDVKNGYRLSGFSSVGEDYYYFGEGGKTLKGWVQTVEGQRYFDENGVMQTGAVNIDGVIHYLDENGLVADGLMKMDGDFYYVSDNGTLATGWIQDEGGWRYFNEDFKMVTGIVTFDDGVYYFDSEGYKRDGFMTIDGAYYFFDPDNNARMHTGWYDSGNGKWYFSESGRVNGWQVLEDGIYYFSQNVPVTGWQTLEEKIYKFDSEGRLITGWTDNASGNKVYMAPTEGYMVTGEYEIDGVKYFFEEDGTCKEGVIDGVFWVHGYKGSGVAQINGKYYYYLEDGSRSTGGWYTVNGKKSHFESDGSATTGWTTVDGTEYFFKADGSVAAGEFVTRSGATVYVNSAGLLQQPGWLTTDGSTYYIADGGKITTGFKEIDGNVYYFMGSGKMAVTVTNIGGKYYAYDTTGHLYSAGWQTISGFKYYVYSDGTVATGTTTIDGKQYVFLSNGALNDESAKAAVLLDVANRYASDTNYIIIVDRAQHLVGIFTGSQGSYSLVKSFSCTVGKNSTPTITGQYKTGDKFYYYDHGNCRLFYATRIHGGYLFHSVLYYKDPSPQRVMDGRVGMNLSLGCVRLQVDNAKYIYDNIPRGTTVYIY